MCFALASCRDINRSNQVKELHERALENTRINPTRLKGDLGVLKDIQDSVPSVSMRGVLPKEVIEGFVDEEHVDSFVETQEKTFNAGKEVER